MVLKPGPLQKQIRKLKATQMRMVRSILNIRLQDKVKISEIKKKKNVRDIGYIIKKMKMKYADHLVRGEKTGTRL